MKVRRIIDTNRLSEIIVKNGNQLLIPVIDGGGNLIIGLEALNDPAFKKVYETIMAITEEADYVPFTQQTFYEVSQKIEQYKQQGKCLILGDNGVVDFAGTKMSVQDVKDLPEKSVLDIVIDVGKSALNWVTSLFK